jgi:hypothetical protein
VSGYRLRKTYSMSLHFPPEQVFPLLCPVREYEWIEPWQCELIHSDTGVAELDCVFKTNFADDGPEDTWVVSRYEPPLLIEFVRINALRSLRYSLSLARNDDGTTKLAWTQIFTGLSPEGDDFIKGLSDSAYRQRMATRERQINHFLATGKMLKNN